MAISISTSKVQYTGNGVTTAFATGFRFRDQTHLVVKQALAASPTSFVTKTLGVDYTVAGTGLDAGGTVTMLAAPANNDLLTIERTVPNTQPTSFRTQGTFSASTHEDEFDHHTEVDQQLDRRVATLEGLGNTGTTQFQNGFDLSSPPRVSVGAGNGIVVSATAVALNFSAIAPADLADSVGVLGTTNDVQKGNHIHAHGNRGGGTLHANSISGGAAGFQSGTDKQRQDSLWARILTAGAGLTGGGDLSADCTIDVVANADGSIVVNANDIQVGMLATDAQHGNRGGGGIHAVATSVGGGVAGFMSGADKVTFDALLASGAFSGTVQTTNATPTSVVVVDLITTKVTALELTVVGRRTTGAEAAGYKLFAVFRGDGGATIQVGVTREVVAPLEDTVAWAVNLVLVGNQVQVQVTGEAGKTIDWACRGIKVTAP